MEAAEAVAALVAVTVPAVLVLREAAVTGRPAGKPVREPEPVREPAREPVRVPEPEPIAAHATGAPGGIAATPDESMLATLTTTEVDERSAVRRIGSLLVLLTLTLLTASLVGAGIYRAVSALG